MDSKCARIIRLNDVMDKVGLKRSSIYARILKGQFPKPISLGCKAVGWVESEIDEWIESRINERVVKHAQR